MGNGPLGRPSQEISGLSGVRKGFYGLKENVSRKKTLIIERGGSGLDPGSEQRKKRKI